MGARALAGLALFSAEDPPLPDELAYLAQVKHREVFRGRLVDARDRSIGCCAHCGQWRPKRRGLCGACYADPAIRARFPDGRKVRGIGA
jgi:hypothetical protein